MSAEGSPLSTSTLLGFSVYEEDVPARPASPHTQRRANQDRTYEVTTTTESFHRTIHPPGTQPGTLGSAANGNAGFGPAPGY